MSTGSSALVHPPSGPSRGWRTFAGLDRQFCVIQSLLQASSSQHQPRLLRLLIGITLPLIAGKAAVACGAWVAGYPVAPEGAPFGSLMHTLLFMGFFGAGLILLLTGRRDRRARYLGASFCLIACAFARRPGSSLEEWTVSSTVIHIFAHQQLDPLLPFFFWLFVREFPKGDSGARPGRVCDAFVVASGVIGTLLISLGTLDLAWRVSAGIHLLPAALLHDGNFYWTAIFGLLTAALMMLCLRCWRSRGTEQLRGAWFGLGLAIGFAPLSLEVLIAAISDGFNSFTSHPDVKPLVSALIWIPLLSIPVTTLYAVAFRRVLDIRLVLRRTLRCSLTKYLAVLVCFAPTVALIGFAYARRTSLVVDVAEEPPMPFLLAVACLGLAALVGIERLLKWIDTVFLQPPYDARTVLADLQPRLFRAANPNSIAELTRRTVAETLRPCGIGALVAIARRAPYVDLDTSFKVLAADSPLVESLARSGLETLQASDRLLRAINTEDAAWLVRCEADLLVALKTPDGHVAALLALGKKTNERAYNSEDLMFLRELTAMATGALHRQPSRGSVTRIDSPAGRPAAAAFECSSCGAMFAANTSSVCTRCANTLEVSPLPLLLAGKFRIQQRIGRGGMGIVYSGVDTELQRRVAVKTLPYVSVAAELRLRREARFMARAVHPNLAGIFGLETWQDRPVLVVEYLSQGTLAERLHKDVVHVSEATSWILDLCSGLVCLHRNGLVHGDIKPSNIGFDAAGAPKLVDFGLAATFTRTGELAEITPFGGIRFGTPFYLCPDAAQSDTVRPEFDLWSLALVLYESLAGEHLTRLSRDGTPALPLPDIREFRHDVPETLARFLRKSLDLRVECRPKSASEFGLWLRHAGPVRRLPARAPLASVQRP